MAKKKIDDFLVAKCTCGTVEDLTRGDHGGHKKYDGCYSLNGGARYFCRACGKEMTVAVEFIYEAK